MTIDNYEVYWDQGSVVNSWTSLTLTSSLTYTELGLTGGITYSFKIRGINKYGQGAFSSVVAIVAG